MGFWDKLLRRKHEVPRETNEAKMLTVYDEFGKELQIAKGDWLHSVLRPSLRKAWNEPDELSPLILSAVQDEFFAEVIEASARLVQLRPDAEMPTVLRAIVLLKTGDLVGSEKVLQNYISRRGPSAVVLTNLAKVYAQKNDRHRAQEVLWRAIELDPNQDNALLWYEAEVREAGGERAGLDAFRRIAALPGSWRAQVWLARAALKVGDLPEARRLYLQSISANGSLPMPTDLLFQVSGDLGQAGHLEELIELVAPHFSPQVHGLSVGNNLIKAYLDLGRIDDAASVLEGLYTLQRPDWKHSLDFWENQVARAKVENFKRAGAPKLNVTLLTMRGPVWLTPDSPGAECFPPGGEAIVTFITGTASVNSPPSDPEMQLGDTVGRLCRGLPLFLAEQTSSEMCLQTACVVPWIAGPPAGFVLSSAEWTIKRAATVAGNTPEARYVVTLHLDANVEPLTVHMRLGLIPNGELVTECVVPLNTLNPGPAMEDLSTRLRAALKACGATERTGWSHYSVPPQELLGHYLLRLEQLLCVRVAGMDGVQEEFLHGEREVLSGAIDLCVSVPESASLRLLLAELCAKLFKLKPELAAEYRKKIERLQELKPLPAAVATPIASIFEYALGNARTNTAL